MAGGQRPPLSLIFHLAHLDAALPSLSPACRRPEIASAARPPGHQGATLGAPQARCQRVHLARERGQNRARVQEIECHELATRQHRALAAVKSLAASEPVVRMGAGLALRRHDAAVSACCGRDRLARAAAPGHGAPAWFLGTEGRALN